MTEQTQTIMTLNTAGNEYAYWDLDTDIPLTDAATVSFAALPRYTEPGSATAWYVGTWATLGTINPTTGHYQRKARIMIAGTASGVIDALVAAPGEYDTWALILDNAERIIRKTGQLYITT